jgi:hypothetical protein
MVEVNGNGQQGLSAQAIRSSQPASRAARSVSRTVVSSTILASTSASFTRARACSPAFARGAGAEVADLEQVGDFGEGKAKALRGFDHPQHRDGFWRIEPVTTQRSVRFVQQSAALVVAQRLHINPRSIGDFPAAQSALRHRRPPP